MIVLYDIICLACRHCVTQRWEAHLWDACAPRAKPAGGGGGGGQQARRTRGKQVRDMFTCV